MCRNLYLLFAIIGLVSSCMPLTPNIKHQYAIEKYSYVKYKSKTNNSILINKPSTEPVYNSTDMLYTNKPYELHAFAHNAWIDPPADMILTVMSQSLQKSNFFKAVATSPMLENTKYRLDSKLISIKQNFITKPSTLEFSIKLVLSDIETNKVIKSQIFSEVVKCPSENPYGGALAANEATKLFTKNMISFVINNLN